MKRLTFALPALLFAAQLALAQQSGPPPGPPRGGPPIERLTQELNLDANQKPEVERIFEAQRAKHEAAREQFKASGQRPTREEMQANMQKDQQELLQQLKGVLNTEQLAKFQQLQEERRNHMHGGPGGPGHEGPGHESPPPPANP